MKYEHVNQRWPEGTHDGRDLKPSPAEAKRGAVLLWNHFAGGKPKPGSRLGTVLPRVTAAKVRLTSGIRHTYWTGGPRLQVNPDQRNGGWHELVHGLSHSVARALYDVGHDMRHAFIEAQMIDYVVRRDWHNGALARPEKPAPGKADRKAQKMQDTLDAIARWERKAKLAATKLKKYRAKARRMEREGVKS